MIDKPLGCEGCEEMNVIQKMWLIVSSKSNRNGVLLTSLLWSVLSCNLAGWSQVSSQSSPSSLWDASGEATLSAANSSASNNGEQIGDDDQNSETANPESGSSSGQPANQLPDQTQLIAAWVNDLKQSEERWIEVNISEQRLTAWEGNTPVSSVTVSTGRADEPTLPGVFAIQTKQEKAWMQGDNYEIPNVPYTMFYSGNYAIHGTYWHHNFGTPVSNGCVNVPVDQAAWLFNWASVGTPVIVEP